MKYTPCDHTFALCAYGESPYLEECIRSLKAQTVQSNILIATSTPSQTIDRLASEYQIPVFVNSVQNGIGSDWNFAYNSAVTALVTITHQDDLYEAQYTANLLRDLNEAEEPIIWFCDYFEFRNGERVRSNRNLRIKEVMLAPFRIKRLQSSRFIRRRILSLGSPICCPSVTYVRENAGLRDIFSTEMKVSLDWDQWEKQSRKKGAFVYCPNPLMSHRIHEASATSELIASSTRSREDHEMYRRFWPGWAADLLERAYAKSENSNKIM